MDEAGKPHWYGVAARSFSSADTQQDEGQPSTGVFAVLRDISVLKSGQRRNADFVSAVSHEMKTPLAGIKAYVELLVDGEAKDEQTQEEFLNVINSQANRLQRLIDNLLNLARIEAGVVQVSQERDVAERIAVGSGEYRSACGGSETNRTGGRSEPDVHRRAGRSRHDDADGDQPAFECREVHGQRRHA